MVCYMYYTDVFVGTNDNIENLKDALEAELNGFDDSNALTQLVHGLCLFMGYPSCLCSLMANVDKSLKDISEKLKEDSEAVQSCLQKPLNLNCSCDSENILCKCCVISCIKELRQSKQCNCVKSSIKECKCSKADGKCCKDFLSGLEACLSLLNLKTDLQDCTCTDPKNCCPGGTCNLSCNVCDPDKSTITGLGLSRPNPVRLAEKLSEMLCGTQKSGQCNCDCGSGASNTSCCCFCHKECTGGNCPSGCSESCPGCSCASKPGECGLQKFCKSINSIKVLVGSKEMTCCEGGKNCHCVSDSGSKCSGSALNCCVVEDKSGKDHFQHSVKCMILRVVKFFKDLPLDASSPDKCSKLCCELICVGKYCDFLKMFYDRGGKDKCGTCNSKGSGNCLGSKITPASNTCCGGASGCQSGNCCQGCQDCDALKFRKALQELKHSSPCGHDLWRVLDDFLYYCFNVFMGQQNFIHSTVIKAVKGCDKCNKKDPKKASDWKACQCSGSSSCEACPKLLNDSKLMSILRHGYVSSYDSSASFPSPSGDDEQKKAAKIFLGMLPCLYYGLKIVFDRCKYGSDFPDWHLRKITEGSIGSFLFAWGFESSHLSSKNASDLPPVLDILYGSGKFKSLLDFVSKKYFSIHVSDASKSHPTTVREMLLWLYGLPFTSGFHDLVSLCRTLSLPLDNAFHPDAVCYYLHLSCFLLPLAVISAIETSDYTVANFFSDAQSKISNFIYPSDPFALLETLFLYVRKIYIPLKFLEFQCERDKNSAGWQDCAFGQSCVKVLQGSLKSSPTTSTSCCAASGPHGILCTSVPGHYNVHEHCISSKSGVSCLGLTGKCEDSGNGSAPTDAHTNGKCTAAGPCPHPLLMFLIDGSLGSQSQAFSYSLFRLPEDSSVPPMGFSPDKLSSPGRNGHVLHDVLKPFCTNGFYPLTRLFKFLTRVSRHPPETLGEFFLFFKKLAEALKSGPLSSKFVEWIEGEPGEYSGSDLKKALEDLYGSSHSSSSHTPANLFSLSSCHATKGSNASCGAYLYSLTEYSSDNLVEDLVDSYLSWVCYLTPKFKTLLEKFQGKFSSCCSTGSCSSIVKCPCALATLYSQGFVYYSPSGLGCWNSWGQEHKKNNGSEKHSGGDGAPGCTRKTCKNFIEQLGKVLEENSPLDLLIKQIESFLWSIRLPFFLFILAFWAFVISYFLYVQLYKLDLLHLKSHAHFSRSFKILPSTLFSDASSKLKDLSYFTL